MNSSPVSLRRCCSTDFEANDSKYKQLIDLLCKKLPDEKAIIFAYFKGTLRYLFRRLVHDGIDCAMIHGDVENEERRAEIERFERNPGVRVLLSSEVGSEGIDLQFCRVIVNYDLPWNPMRVEQRIGRIDRVGQKADRLSIVHLKVKDTIEERLFERLHDKLGIFENSIGDLEAVLGEEIQKLTVELLSKDLTPEEEDERIELTRRVVEKKLRLMQQLEEEGESLLALSDLIASRIEQSRELGRYVTRDELQKYITDFFARNFKGCILEWDVPAPQCFRLELTFDAEDSFLDFIRTWRLQSVWQTLGRKFVGTLDPETASSHARVAYRPASHFRKPPFAIGSLDYRSEQAEPHRLLQPVRTEPPVQGSSGRDLRLQNRTLDVLWNKVEGGAGLYRATYQLRSDYRRQSR